MKWVESMMVLPFLHLERRSQVALRAQGSIPEVGSSRTTNWDPPTRARATLNEGEGERRELVTYVQP